MHALTVTDEHVLWLDAQQRARRCQAKQRRNAEPLRRRAVVLRGTDRIGTHERAVLRQGRVDVLKTVYPPYGESVARMIKWMGRLFT